MERWKLDIKNDCLRALYDNYLFRTDKTTAYYLASIAFNDMAIFQEDTTVQLRASENFPDGFTSIKTLEEIKHLRDSGEYLNLACSHCIFSLTTSFTDFFEELRVLLAIDQKEIKPPFPLKMHGGLIYNIRPAALKISHYISKKYALLENITNQHETMYINSIISLRHMYVHEKGNFSEAYREHVTPRWKRLQSGDRIIFDRNDFDDVLHMFNMTLRGYVQSLDEKLQLHPQQAKISEPQI